MSEIHALSGAYAVDALDAAERELFEQHLAACPACHAEIASLREAAATLPEMAYRRPPPGLRDRLLADIATVRPLPPVVEPTPFADAREQLRMRRRSRSSPVVAGSPRQWRPRQPWSP